MVTGQVALALAVASGRPPQHAVSASSAPSAAAVRVETNVRPILPATWRGSAERRTLLAPAPEACSMMHSAPVPLTALALAVCAAATGAQKAPDARAVKLFHDNCAQCHGDTGDGKGWAQLDRPARSFKDGGFSFGNTPEALFRTITVGIPGTPMPSFDSALGEQQRKLLADYVVTLGPPVEEVKLEDT